MTTNGRGPSMSGYRIANHDGHFSLTVPKHIVEALPDDLRYECALTEDGILFRPMTTPEIPEWAKASA